MCLDISWIPRKLFASRKSSDNIPPPTNYFWFGQSPASIPQDLILKQSTTPAVAYVSSTALLNLQHSAPPPSAISFPRPLAPAYSVVLVLAQFHAFDLFTEALISSSGSATYFFLRWRNPNCTQYPQQMRTTFRNDFLNCLSEINTITTQCFHLPKLAQCFSARTFSNVCSLNHLG